MSIETESLNEEDLVEFFDNDDDEGADNGKKLGGTPGRFKSSTIISEENKSSSLLQANSKPSALKRTTLGNNGVLKTKIKR